MKVAIVTDSLTNLTAVDLERYPYIYYGYLFDVEVLCWWFL